MPDYFFNHIYNYEGPATIPCSSPSHPQTEQFKGSSWILYLKNPILILFGCALLEMSVFKSNFTFTAAKEMTGEEKHSQYISAINSIHNCPAVCAWRNQSVSFRGFHHWKLILRIQRQAVCNMSGMCTRSHRVEETKWNPDLVFLGLASIIS